MKKFKSCFKPSNSDKDKLLKSDDKISGSPSFLKWMIKSRSKASTSVPEPTPNKPITTADDVWVATKGLHEDCYLSRGRTSKVYKCRHDYPEIFAFKVLSMGRIAEYNAEQQFLGYLQHENIVQLKGVCTMILLLEYVPNGTLYHRLQGTGARLLSWESRMKIALGVAKAVDYIHHAKPGPVIHRDIKSTHIVLDTNDKAKLIDFGTAILEPEGKRCQDIEGTEPYIAPEYKSESKLATCCDIYALGIVFLELLTGRLPIQDGESLTEWVKSKLNPTVDCNAIVPYLIDEKIRPTVPLEDMLRLMKLATDCILVINYLERPDSTRVISRLLEVSCLTHLASSSSTGSPRRIPRAPSRSHEGYKLPLDPIIEE